MVSSNLPPQILKILSPQTLSLKLDAIKLEVFARTFSAGQTVQGRVAQTLPQGRAVMNFEGRAVLVEVGQSLKAGQILTARVEQTTPSPVLKLLSLEPAPQTSNRGQAGGPAPQNPSPTQTPRPGVTATFSPQAMQKENRIRQNNPQNASAGKPPLGQNEPNPAAAREPGPFKQMQKPAGDTTDASRTSPTGDKPVSPRSPHAPASSRSAASTSNAAQHFKQSGIVARFSTESGVRAQAEPVLTRAELQHLDLKPNVRASLTTVRVADGQTVIARRGHGEVAVSVAHARVFRPGDPVVVTPRPVQNGFVLSAKTDQQVLRPVTPQMIKPLMTARQPFGDMVASLQKNVVHHPVLKAMNIAPEMIDTLRETLRLFHPQKGGDVEAARIREMVDRSGIQYEAKVHNLLLQGETGGRANRIQFDLKGQLMELANRLEDGASKAAESAAGRTRSLQEVLQTVQRAVQNIEFHQLSHQVSRQEQLPHLLPIPHSFFEGGSELRIYVRRQEEEESGSGKPQQDTFNLVFLLDMTALGELRLDTQVRGEGVSVTIQGDNEPVIDFIRSHIPDLEAGLQEMGFSAHITGTVREHVDRDVPDAVTEWVIHEPTRLVDIKT